MGIGNAISDDYLVVYYPHMLVHPEFQGQGIGRKMMAAMQEIYRDFNQQILTAGTARRRDIERDSFALIASPCLFALVLTQ